MQNVLEMFIKIFMCRTVQIAEDCRDFEGEEKKKINNNNVKCCSRTWRNAKGFLETGETKSVSNNLNHPSKSAERQKST